MLPNLLQDFLDYIEQCLREEMISHGGSLNECSKHLLNGPELLNVKVEEQTVLRNTVGQAGTDEERITR
jgi:hypothetical protein